MIRPTPNATIPTDWKSPEELAEVAAVRMRQGFAPPAEVYRVPYRSLINWSDFPDWAQPIDPEAFEGCCHEG